MIDTTRHAARAASPSRRQGSTKETVAKTITMTKHDDINDNNGDFENNYGVKQSGEA